MKKSIVVFGKEYPTIKSGVFAYLDSKKVFSGTVVPPSVTEFNTETGNDLVHGCYGARLDEYCVLNRVDRIKLKTGVASDRFSSSKNEAPVTKAETVVNPTTEPENKVVKPAKPSKPDKVRRSKNIRVGSLLISKDTKRDPMFEEFLNEKSPVIQAFFMDIRREYVRRCGRHAGDVKFMNIQTNNGSHETVVVRGIEQYVLNNTRELKRSRGD